MISINLFVNPSGFLKSLGCSSCGTALRILKHVSLVSEVAFSSLLKSLSKNYSGKNISTINIAPGPFKTNRVKELVSDMRNFEKKLPTGKIGNPDEIGLFVKYVMENRIKYLSGSTIYFDGNINKNFM